MTNLWQNCLLSASLATAAATATGQALDADLKSLIQRQKQQIEQTRNSQAPGMDQILKQGQEQSRSAPATREAVSAMGMAPQANPGGYSASQQVKTSNAIVFISLGMPDEDLRYLFAEAAARPDVIFLLRGTFNNSMEDTMQRIITIIGTDNLKKVPSVMILPQAFSNYRVTSVPTVFMRGKDKKNWYQVFGAPSLAFVKKEIEAGRANHTVGKMWPVAEEDIADRMRAAIAGYDWKGWQKGLSSDLQRKYQEGHQLPYALSDASYPVDLSITFPSDVTDKDGKVVVKAGTRFNPLEKADVPGGAMIVIDPADARQRAMAKQWLKRWPAGIVFVTRYVEDGVRDLGVKAVMLDAISTARFQLQSVPSLLTAANKQLLVQTYAPRVEGGVQ